jgi:hypothetical protein
MEEDTKIIVFFDFLIDAENKITILSNKSDIKLAMMGEASDGLTEFNDKKYEILTLAETKGDEHINHLFSTIQDEEYENTINALNTQRFNLKTDIATMQKTINTIDHEINILKSNKQKLEEKL